MKRTPQKLRGRRGRPCGKNELLYHIIDKHKFHIKKIGNNSQSDLLKDPQIRSRSTDPNQFLKIDLHPQIQSTFLEGTFRSRTKDPVTLIWTWIWI